LENVPTGRIVERTFAWISRFRLVSQDFERDARTVTAFVRPATIRVMLTRIASPSSST
jgi:transposase